MLQLDMSTLCRNVLFLIENDTSFLSGIHDSLNIMQINLDHTKRRLKMRFCSTFLCGLFSLSVFMAISVI